MILSKQGAWGSQLLPEVVQRAELISPPATCLGAEQAFEQKKFFSLFDQKFFFSEKVSLPKVFQT